MNKLKCNKTINIGPITRNPRNTIHLMRIFYYIVDNNSINKVIQQSFVIIECQSMLYHTQIHSLEIRLNATERLEL